MEYHGYHRWGTDYNKLTQEQALFLDYGLAELLKEMYGGDEKGDKTTRNTFNKHGRRKWHID